ncbi:hypothetical protein Bphy_5707 (plasmid) [Paraburkholderia phymatum STM815]|uniref:Uncharacterized protein n=1 Tax=Paraburkholderia phymatum (strain DSM 17167 / CIP 108236 / LMG 21445 / STM815) TaxID=391038 RepID=B2JV01_PARP8|nr:hypothetical protein Bphy_5707 [Paraburkholderia phymatum STM815]
MSSDAHTLSVAHGLLNPSALQTRIALGATRARCHASRHQARVSGNLKSSAAGDVPARIARSNVFSESAICFAARVARCRARVRRMSSR